jgi:hypothetical protein
MINLIFINKHFEGPIVRFNPRELHIKDPFYYDSI